MAQATKMTFTLDQTTVETIKELADRLRKPQSWVVREAVAVYGQHEDRTSPAERERMMAALRALMATPATRSAADQRAELREIRRARQESR